MATYTYQALAKDGKTKKGQIDAENLEKARAAVKAEGMTVLKIEEANALNKDINISFGGKKKIKPRDMAVFCKQFVSILRAGVGVVTALEMMGEQTEDKVLKEAVINMKDSVEKGDTLSVAMRKEQVFPNILLSMIEAGEASGSLEISLERMAEHFEKDSRVKAMVKKALIYPCVLMVVALIVMVIMLVVVIPNFEAMFANMGGELPAFTQIVVGLSESLQENWLIYIIVIVAVVVAFTTYKKTNNGARTVAKLVMKIPVFGLLGVKSSCSRFARTISTLIAAGMPMIEAIEITARTMDNILFKDALNEAARQVERGMPLSAPLKACGLFPSMIIHMLTIGEETGNMEEMLRNAANYYDEEVENTTQQATALMEPVIIVFMALIVVMLIGAVYSPMLTMYESVG